ncbi:MAG: DMT family transporter [Muribaculaceae bacterium]|nr:DMT family transporter [Muribaculaceae bacterium]
MMKSKLKGNVAMGIAKIFSGLNENALRYLLPTWMGPITGVLLRLAGGTILFFLWGVYMDRRDPSRPKASVRDRLWLFVIGIVMVYGYMWALLEGLTYTTPISSSIFISLQPAWVFIICLIMHTERATVWKVVGLLLGFGGALLCILTGHHSDVASDPFKGNMYCLLSSVLYAGYLVAQKVFLKRLDNSTVSMWTFFGGAAAAVVAVLITGWDAKVFTQGLFSTPMLILGFVIFFPSFISYLLQDIGLKNLPATVVALYGDVILIVATIASYILGQDHFSWWQMLAIVMMLVSVYFVEAAERKTHSAPATSKK